MPYNDPDDDEDWSGEDWSDDEDGDDESDDEKLAVCPECGRQVAIITDKCPACGYWLLAADRQTLYAGRSKWLRVVAWVVLVAMLLHLLAAGILHFFLPRWP